LRSRFNGGVGAAIKTAGFILDSMAGLVGA
jgi:hypothetical protein